MWLQLLRYEFTVKRHGVTLNHALIWQTFITVIFSHRIWNISLLNTMVLLILQAERSSCELWLYACLWTHDSIMYALSLAWWWKHNPAINLARSRWQFFSVLYFEFTLLFVHSTAFVIVSSEDICVWNTSFIK